MTSAPNGLRKKDHYDFAFCQMPDEFVSKLGSVKHVQKDRLGDDRTASDERTYVALGYRNSQNKKVDVEGKIIRPTPGSYTGVVRPDLDLAKKLGISGRDHFFLKADKYSKDEKGTKVNTANPLGFSGGALIDMGCIARDLNKLPNGWLAGVLIEAPTSIIAVKIGVILHKIHETYG